MVSNRGQAVLISLRRRSPTCRGQNGPVDCFEAEKATAVARTVGRKHFPSLPSDWGLSSAGRASALQAEGHRFDPDRLHQELRPAPAWTAQAAGSVAQVVRAHA
jgi:hypothetical protein